MALAALISGDIGFQRMTAFKEEPQYCRLDLIDKRLKNCYFKLACKKLFSH